ncbi:MAG: efflux RND transporter periplasmic adaptor subunit, partial [Alphaproteobacteria bacterium]|nr:efflux RND transporter periplasmic adaptor subunit [Alphaproteobacteria bacterium]
VEEAKANLDVATIDLDNTQVRAPISGKIGKALVTKGNYVVASQVVLAKIVQINPVRISFSMTDKEYATIKKRGFKIEDLTARITLATGDVITEDVVDTFVDNSVNPATATLSVYADVANDAEMLVPGNYVQSAISDNKPDYAITVPQTAINYDKDGAFVYVVRVDEEKSKENDLHGVAEQRRVVLGDTINGVEQAVINGLSEEDMVVVQGNIKIRNGSPIKIGVLEQ